MNFIERKMGLIKGGVFLIIGVTLMEIMLAYRSDYYMFQMILYLSISIILSLVGIFKYLIPGLKKGSIEYIDTDFAMKHGDVNRLEKNLESFRNHYAEFFQSTGITENAPVQRDTTQYFKNILDLQKIRLDQRNVKIEMMSQRRKYTDTPVRDTVFSDGKYQIREVEEEIEAYRKYIRNGKVLLVRHDSEVAHYTMINAKKTDNKMVVCPNCGARTTRENLIDGCDYCKTKFTVEDLGEKMAGFAIRDDYKVAHAKYKRHRKDYLSAFFIISFIVLYLLLSFCISVLMFDEATGMPIGTTTAEATSPIILLFGFIASIGSFVSLIVGAAMLAGLPVVFPAMEIGAALKYNSKKKLEKLRKAQEAERSKENVVKAFDPLFSIMGFYSNVQSKASVLLFDDGKRGDPKYHNVIDYDVNTIELTDYKVENGLQKAKVNMNLCLYEMKNKKIRARNRKTTLNLMKSADCKTQAVCAPSVMTCKKCGSSLSFAEDLVCAYCGNELDLKQYDWEIVK